MSVQEQPIETLARTYTETAAAAFLECAGYLRVLPPEAWDDPTGSSEWSIRTLANHIVGEALYFPNLVRGVAENEPALPSEAYEKLQTLPPDELIETCTTSAQELRAAMSNASGHLEYQVDIGLGPQPLWEAINVAAMEATLHNWDAHVGRDPSATIPAAWAEALALRIHEFVPFLSQKGDTAGADATYLLQVGDDIGPVTITVTDGNVQAVRGATGTPDVVLELTPDQYVRLMWGRLDLESALEYGSILLRGDPSRAARLTQIFRGA